MGVLEDAVAVVRHKESRALLCIEEHIYSTGMGTQMPAAEIPVKVGDRIFGWVGSIEHRPRVLGLLWYEERYAVIPEDAESSYLYNAEIVPLFRIKEGSERNTIGVDVWPPASPFHVRYEPA